jgi:ATP-dependent DNA ligase
MTLPVAPPLEPMLAKAESAIPREGDWLYEPKWDGFRALIFRDGADLRIDSRNSLPLQRYFPELVEPLQQALPGRCVVDGEIVIATPNGLDFDALQMRLHPAASRVKMLAAQNPASVVLFDLLALDDDDLRERPLRERRALLLQSVDATTQVGITPQTLSPDEATQWFERYEGAGLDGVVAKRADGDYRHGERRWVKVKHLRTADCVVGGFRPLTKGVGVGSLLLGLYDDGILHHVGHTSGFSASERKEILARLEPLIGGDSFGYGAMPGAPSRWNRGADHSFTSVHASLVCEVSFDHLQGRRFRHAARFLRWRPDREPTSCTFEQLAPPEEFALEDIVITPHR